MKTLICIPTRGNVRKELAAWLFGQLPRGGVGIIFDSQFPLSFSRNHLITKALELYETNHIERIMLVDSDVVPPMNAITKMVDDDVDFVSGLYYGMKGDKLTPQVYVKHRSEYIPHQSIERWNGLVEVDAVGLGCLMINPCILRDALIQPYFDFPLDNNGVLLKSEDIYFCEKIKRNGFTIHVDPTVVCDHFQTVNTRLLVKELNPKTSRMVALNNQPTNELGTERR